MINKILDLVLPRQCIWCGKKWDYICNKCKKTLIPHAEICPICHNPSKGYKVCVKCWTQDFMGIMIWFKYQGMIKNLLLKIKFWHKKDIWDFIAQRLNLIISTNEILTHIDSSQKVLTYVPSHRYKKYFLRWYNQSEVICSNLSKISWINMIKICKKILYTKSQTKLNRKARLCNLNWSFDIINWINIKWNENIIIVDDITTTWSTIREMSKIIKNSYPNTKIRWLVVARH